MELLDRQALLDALEEATKHIYTEGEREGFDIAYSIVECFPVE